MSLNETTVITTQMAIAVSGTLKGGVLTHMVHLAAMGVMNSGATGMIPVVGNILMLMIVADNRGNGDNSAR